MVTAEEIGAVELFAALGPAERERLARAAADISLGPGEYAAHEGDERALFAVLEGRIEAVKLVDGIERVVGVRQPGEIFGEVPIALGTVFPVGFRAAEASRVLRLEPHDYHAVAAVAPGRRQGGRRLARRPDERARAGCRASPPSRRRRGRSWSGHRWDAACAELRRFLDRNQVTFSGSRPTRRMRPRSWGGPLPADDDLPAIRVVDGKTVVRPQLRRVAELLGLGTEPAAGSTTRSSSAPGPAGLAAAVYGASEGLRTIVVEREAPGGQAGTSSRIENYLGFPSGRVRRRAGEPRAPAGAAARRRDPRDPDDHADRRATRQVHLDGGDVLRARTIILACGVAWRHLSIDGFDRLAGKGISYGAARSEAPGTHGLDVHIVGAGNSAGQAAMFFATHARSVTILCRGDRLEKSMSRYLVDQLATRSNIRTLSGPRWWPRTATPRSRRSTSATRDRRDDAARLGRALHLHRRRRRDGVAAARDRARRAATCSRAPTCAPRAAGSSTATRTCSRRACPGIFACGDVRFGPVKRVAAAVGEGSMAIAFVHQYLREPEAHVAS